jgi:hypothetical protein
MRRYAIPLVIATVLLLISATMIGGGLRFVHASFPSWYHSLVLARSLEAPPPLGPPTLEETARCAAALRDRSRETVRRYFAEGAFDPETEGFWKNRYSNTLCLMREPLLSAPSVGDARYRLLWMRSFHSDASIRIELSSGVLHAYSVQLPSDEDGQPEIRIERQLEISNLDRIRESLASAHFWKLPTSEHESGLDGSRWVLEVSEPDRYHLVSRFMGGEIERVGREMIALSGLNPKEVY